MSEPFAELPPRVPPAAPDPTAIPDPTAAPDPNLLLPAPEATALDLEAAGWPEVALTAAELSNLELLLAAPAAGSGSFDVLAPPGVAVGDRLALRDAEGVLLAALTVERLTDARAVGIVTGIRLPAHPDAADLRRTPEQLAEVIGRRGWASVAAVVTGRPLFQSDLDRIRQRLTDHDGLVVALLAGGTEATDPGQHGRLAAVRAGLATLPDDRVLLTLLPADPTSSPDRRRELAAAYGLPVPSAETLPSAEALDVAPAPGSPTDAEVRAALDANDDLARRLLQPEGVRNALRHRHRPRAQQGLVLLFTGLSGSGKSTVAGLLAVRLQEATDRYVLLLDGDRVRRHLTAGLGFSRADRVTNVRRIGWVAAQVAAAGGIAVCAPIAPYDSTRHEVRALVEGSAPAAGFVLVHIATPLEECERRDRKGLYARARAGLLPEFTGISDPYEEPSDAEVVADTTGRSPASVVEDVLAHLVRVGYLSPGE